MRLTEGLQALQVEFPHIILEYVVGFVFFALAMETKVGQFSDAWLTLGTLSFAGTMLHILMVGACTLTMLYMFGSGNWGILGQGNE